MVDYYKMLFKRKSIMDFSSKLHLSKEDKEAITDEVGKLTALVDGVEVRTKLVPIGETTSKRGEYCLLIYSKDDPVSLLNVGYMFEQFDLFLASRNIGAYWCALSRPAKASDDTDDYTIMFCMGKCKEGEFRTDFTKCKRKTSEEIWDGKFDDRISHIVRFAPSSINSQPWRVKYREGVISVYRKINLITVRSERKTDFYNQIDMGIFLFFLEVLLKRYGYEYDRTVIDEPKQEADRMIKIAEYKIKGK